MQVSVRLIQQVAVACLVLLCICGKTTGQSHPNWGSLQSGPYGVGFKTLWQFDFSRTYNFKYEDSSAYAAAKAPRPILINIWYPAKATTKVKPMLHRGYLDIKSADPQLEKFSAKLIEYNKGIIIKELLDKPESELSQDERSLIESFFNTPTAAIRNGDPQSGRFPLIIYHAGYGSSIEDNSVLCEFLASHGYVVINSAYQRSDGSSLNIDGQEGSVLDMKYLIGYASQLPNVNWRSVGIIGHSGGAQASLIFQSNFNSVADALVSLDTTQDYYSLLDTRWNYMTEPVTKNINNMAIPMLAVAAKEAIFQMFDLLKHAERYYLTTSNLEHNDFISQGVIANTFKFKLGKSGDPITKEKLEALRADYEAVCQYVLHFFGLYLKQDDKSREYLLTKYKESRFEAPTPHVEYIPKQVTAADKYDASSSMPPNPRQIRLMLTDYGAEKTFAVLRSFWTKNTRHPIYDLVFVLSLVNELIDSGKVSDAVKTYTFYSGLDDRLGRIPRSMVSLGEYYLKAGNKQKAIDLFKKALTLEPDNQKTALRLKEAEGATPKPN